MAKEDLFTRLTKLDFRDSWVTQNDMDILMDRVRIANGEKAHGIIGFMNTFSFVLNLITLPLLVLKLIFLLLISGYRNLKSVSNANLERKSRSEYIKNLVEEKRLKDSIQLKDIKSLDGKSWYVNNGNRVI